MIETDTVIEASNEQYIINGSNGSATTTPGGIGVAQMRKQSNSWQRPSASRYSSISGEVGRKFRDLIQGDGGTAIGKTSNGRTMRVLSRNAGFLGSSVP